MTKKDYIKIADVLKRAKDDIEQEPELSDDVKIFARITHSVIVGRFADMLSQDNSRFDRESFLKACGYNS